MISKYHLGVNGFAKMYQKWARKVYQGMGVKSVPPPLLGCMTPENNGIILAGGSQYDPEGGMYGHLEFEQAG